MIRTEILEVSNRQNGDWLPGVEGCLNRAVPCGNALCIDEAMRSGQIYESNKTSSEHALSHAGSIARKCFRSEGCPLRLASGDQTPEAPLLEIKTFHQRRQEQLLAEFISR